MFYYLLIITLLFIIWSEYSVGGILFRPDSTGNLSFNIRSLLNYMINPFYKSVLWTWETLDINYAFIIGYSLLIYYLIKE